MGLSRTGRTGPLAAHCAEARAVSALRAARAFAAFCLPCVFCSLLRERVFVLQAAWGGVAVSCLVWFSICFGRASRFLTRVARVKSEITGQFRNHGFFLLRIQITLIFSDQLSQRSRVASAGEHGLVA